MPSSSLLSFVTLTPILSFFVMTDPLLLASGSVLMQKDGNGDLHPCIDYSKTFTLAQ